MRRHVVGMMVAALTVLATGAAAAQEPEPKVRIITSYGRTPGSILGNTEASGAEAAFADQMAAGTGSLGVQVRTPIRLLDLRAMMSYSRPTVRVFDADGEVFASRAQVATLTVDAVVKGPRILDARPYALVGGALRYYGFDQGRLAASGAPIPRDGVVPLLHLGAGASWDVGRYELFMEGSAYFGSAPGRDVENGPNWAGASQHHAKTFTVGLRIPVP